MGLYRVQQFMRTIGGPKQPPDLGECAGLLNAQQAALFSSMALVDQYHCLAVARALAAQGFSDPELLQAALIHDVGKSVTPIAVWERVAHVLLLRIAPGMVGRLGSSRPGWPGHGLFILARHMPLGADLALRAGFSPAVVALVRGEGDAALHDALRRADDTH
jgi:hypothetical protein